MAGAGPRDRTSRATNPAPMAAGSSHRSHGAVFARPGGPGWDTRIVVLLRGGQPRWLYSGTRGTAGRDSADTLAAGLRPSQAASTTSMMISASTLSAAMPSEHRQLPTSP